MKCGVLPEDQLRSADIGAELYLVEYHGHILAPCHPLFAFPRDLDSRWLLWCVILFCASLYTVLRCCTRSAVCAAAKGIGSKTNRDAPSMTEKQIMAQSYMNVEWPRQT
jgi:hypothetical protein